MRPTAWPLQVCAMVFCIGCIFDTEAPVSDKTPGRDSPPEAVEADIDTAFDAGDESGPVEEASAKSGEPGQTADAIPEPTNDKAASEPDSERDAESGDERDAGKDSKTQSGPSTGPDSVPEPEPGAGTEAEMATAEPAEAKETADAETDIGDDGSPSADDSSAGDSSGGNEAVEGSDAGATENSSATEAPEEKASPAPAGTEAEAGEDSPAEPEASKEGTDDAAESQPQAAPEAASEPAAAEASSETASATAAPIDEKAREAAVAGTDPPPEAPATSGVLFTSDFEGEDASCWNGGRSGDKVSAGCGPWRSIGAEAFHLVRDKVRRSGAQSLEIRYTENEQQAGATLVFDEESIHYRAYMYFDHGFDFGQGIKIGRLSSFNEGAQVNDLDIILAAGSTPGAPQCGVTDMSYLGLFYNGGLAGSNWGDVTASFAFERGRWYAVEVQVRLNSPGRSDGVARIWVEGELLIERTDLNIRNARVKLNRARVGGWYSNSARGNPCPNPSGASRLYLDDIALSRGFIGP